MNRQEIADRLDDAVQEFRQVLNESPRGVQWDNRCDMAILRIRSAVRDLDILDGLRSE